MSSLEDLQARFQAYLLRSTAGIESEVLGSERVSAATRLGIYGNAYAARLIEAMESNYPALARLLDEDFEGLARAYVARYDSPFFSIRWYGDELADFLARDERYAEIPVLAELARWEWALRGAFDAADAPVLKAEALATVAPADWAQLRFTFHPSVARLALHWNVPALWQALTGDTERPQTSFSRNAVDWVIWREDFTSYFRSLEPPEGRVLDGALAGWPFGELCEALCESVGEERAPQAAAGYLRTWIGAGMISALR